MAEEKRSELRVVMFPWLAHGHITPYIQFAKILASHGFRIFFVSTPLNIKRITPQILQVSRIDPVELAMPFVDGVPPGVESTADVKAEVVPLLFQAMDLLEKPFEALLRQLSPHFVIHDIMQFWIPPMAAKLAIPTILFLTSGVASISFGQGQVASGQQTVSAQDLTVTPPGFPSAIVRRQMFVARKNLPSYQKNQKGVRFVDRISMCLRGSWVVASNTCLELEGVYVEYMQSLVRKPVLPVGILMPHLPPRPAADFCLDWLDRQAACSVVFVSFGSECPLTNEEVSALLMGLEDSTSPFLCVLPVNHGAPTLPQAFQHRNRERGVVVTTWVPQLHILNHLSMGAFMTHCGWNSVTEGLRFKVPLITLPMQFDQGLNAILVEELKVGVEVRRNEDDGSFTKEDISKAIITLMMEEEGTQIKCNVAKINNILTDNGCQIHQKNIENFISMLKSTCK